MGYWNRRRRYEPKPDPNPPRPFPFVELEGPVPDYSTVAGYREIARGGSYIAREYMYSRRAVESPTGGIYIGVATVMGWQYVPGQREQEPESA